MAARSWGTTRSTRWFSFSCPLSSNFSGGIRRPYRQIPPEMIIRGGFASPPPPSFAVFLFGARRAPKRNIATKERFMPFPIHRKVSLTLLVIVILSAGCQAAPAQPLAPPAATVAAQQPSPMQSPTLPATASARASATPTPSATPAATSAATPTATPTPTPAPTATRQPTGPGGLPFPLKTGALQFGVASHLFYTSRALPLKRANEAGFGWIRQQIHWSDQEGPPGRYAWGELDAVVDAVHAAKLNLLLSVVSAPRFYTANGGHGMPKDPVKLGNFVAALTKHYRGRIQAIEIWNEQNLAVENGGRVAESDAGHYVELLKEAYTRIKAVDPSIYVVAGPPSSTGVTDARIAIDDMAYYEAMYSY